MLRRRPSPAAPPKPRRRIRKLRLLVLLGLLALLSTSAFVFGFVNALAARSPSSTPATRCKSRRTGTSTRTTAARSWPSCAARRAGPAPARADRPGDEARDRRDRGPPLLRAPGRRPARHRARGLAGPLEPGARPGRLDDHAAVRQERARRGRPHDQPEGEGGRARVAARAAVERQGPDRHGLPEHHLLRQRRLRRPAGRADVLRPRRVGARPGRGGAARRDPGRPFALRPAHASAECAGTAEPRAPLPLRAGEDQPPRPPRHVGRAAAQARGRPSTRGGDDRRAVLRELRQGRADRPLRRALRLRRRAARDDDDRPPAPAHRAARDRQVARRRARADGRARRARSARRLDPGDGRRPELPREPVQPRRAGGAPAGLVVQAVRARRGAPGRDRPRLDVRLEAEADLARRQALVGPQLRERLPRRRSPSPRRRRTPTTRSTRS